MQPACIAPYACVLRCNDVQTLLGSRRTGFRGARDLDLGISVPVKERETKKMMCVYVRARVCMHKCTFKQESVCIMHAVMLSADSVG